MPKLPSIKSQVPTLAPLIGIPTGDRKAWLKQRDENVGWRKWYRTKRWQRLRWQTLTKAMFTCAMCGRIEADTSKLVCDHIKPHRGNETLFYDENNLQCLCKQCHDSIKQRLENRQRVL
ncbi:HNH endonuclease [Bartonella sp. W8097]|uniref:HNH endonuclease n=1 Tax=Bartonella apihabitans TaxID=2750929 RepID=UPI0018DD9CAD|nr:HNH endonuclease signature motif containing protein [Bartonella apihabitans]MBI0021013.1 HNH endonuclease [Bartonella apihabitans]